MADYAVLGYACNGSLLAANLLSQQTTLLSSSFSDGYTGTISDDGDQLTIGEPITINRATPPMMSICCVISTASSLRMASPPDRCSGQIWCRTRLNTPRARL